MEEAILKVNYISGDVDLNLLSPAFKEAVASYLAYSVCMILTDKLALAQKIQRDHMFQMTNARAYDSMLTQVGRDTPGRIAVRGER